MPSIITKGDSYNIIETYTTNNLSGSTVNCISNLDINKNITNTNQLTTTGNHNITCTVKTGAGKTTTVTKNIEITYKAYTITNLFTDGSFETINRGNNSILSSEYKISGNTSLKVQTNEKYYAIDIGEFSTPINHVFYISGYTRVDKLTDGYVLQELHVPDHSTWNIGSWYYWKSNSQWERQSIYGISTSNFSVMRLGVWENTDTILYYDDFMIIDLTTTFGSGNEPNKEWCDKHINYFDGTATIYM